MNTRMLKLVRQRFNSDLVSREVNRANQRKWARAMRHLGDRWVCAQPVQRRQL